MKVEFPEGKDALSEFVLFRDRVYENRSIRWPANLANGLALLMHETASGEDRTFRPIVVRDGANIAARAVAVLDARYNRHWNERLGHVISFEAMPDTREAVRMLMDAACEWLKHQGAEAARAGCLGATDMPFVVDDYESLPPMLLRHNPAYYHRLLKDAGFETERGWVDYKMPVTPELTARYESALEAARRGGFEIVPVGQVPEKRRISEYTNTFNDTFRLHWGYRPTSDAESAQTFSNLVRLGVNDLSVLAYHGSDPAGFVFLIAEATKGAVAISPRTVQESERLNVLGIGVRDAYRGRGLNLAMASYSYLELIRRGATWLSYTLVLDDNWPSRRTGEKLGGECCANYLTYRRNFRN
jgi:GNAT superfamily N-acetyltransferase